MHNARRPGTATWPLLAVRLRAVTAAVLTALVVIAGAGTITGGAASAACPVSVIMVPGTTETNSNANPNVAVGMLKPITDPLASRFGSGVKITYIPYAAAAFTNGKAYTDSKKEGADKLRKAIADACGKVIFGGYSQGADIAGDEASAIGNGRSPVKPDKILAVGLLADPGQGVDGETVVGPKINGRGISGSRPGGMGKLAGRVATICNPGDLYCNLDRENSPLIANIANFLALTPGERAAKAADDGTNKQRSAGAAVSNATQQVVSNPASAFTTNAPGQGTKLISSITQDWSSADLPGLPEQVSTLSTLLNPTKNTSGSINLDQISQAAKSITGTLTPLEGLFRSGTADKTTRTEIATNKNLPGGAAAAKVLDTAGGADLPGALASAKKLTSMTEQTSGARTVPLQSSQARELATVAANLSKQSGPLAAADPKELGDASGVLANLGPQKMVSQSLGTYSVLSGVDLGQIVTSINTAVQRAMALDARGVQTAITDLIKAIEPLVAAATKIDFGWVSGVLSTIPDPSGQNQIVGALAGTLGRVDLNRLLDIARRTVDILSRNAFPELLPVGIDLAQVAGAFLTGGRQPGPAAPVTPGSAVSKRVGAANPANLDFLGLANSFTGLKGGPLQTLANMVNDGVDAATFWGGGVKPHIGYGDFKVDNSGRSALKWFSDWYAIKLQSV